MHPILFKIGSFEIRSFAVMMVLAVLAGLWMARSRAKRYGIEQQLLWDVGFWAVIAGILGARIVFIVQDWDYYSRHRDQLLSFKFEGLTSFGAVLFGLTAVLIWARVKRVPILPLLDMFGPPFLLSSAIGRVGCLLNGCCYGVHTDLPIGVNMGSVAGNPHHPAQIYESAMLLAGMAFVLFAEGRSLRSGCVIALSMVVYGSSRFIYEFWRAGTEAEVRSGLASSTYWNGLPITQAHATALAILVIGLVMFIICARRPAANGATMPA